MTESNIEFFLNFLPTPLTILKSESFLLPCRIVSKSTQRILLASIKHLGNAPCPQCLITKNQIQDLGMKRDEWRRESLI